MDHSKMSKRHKRNPTFAGFSVCGIGGPGVSGRIKLVDDWAKVDCGNCIACGGGSDAEPLPEPMLPRVLYRDSLAGHVTIWELEQVSGHPTRMWPLNLAGQRMPVHPCPTYRQVEDAYGPLTEVSELDVLARYTRSLESRLAEGNM